MWELAIACQLGMMQFENQLRESKAEREFYDSLKDLPPEDAAMRLRIHFEVQQAREQRKKEAEAEAKIERRHREVIEEIARQGSLTRGYM